MINDVKITYKNLIDKYIMWEERHNLFEWKMHGVKVWEYIRFAVFEIINYHLRDGRFRYYYYYIKENIKSSFIGVVNELPKQILHRADVLFINLPRRQEIDGIYYSPFLDGLVENLKYSYYVLEARAKADRSIPIVTPNCLFYNPDNIGVSFVDMDKVNEKLSQFFRVLEHDFDFQLSDSDKTYVTKFVYSVIQNRKIYKTYYRLMLTRIRPKLVVVVGAALQYNRYLIETAKEMNIPVVEYAHGLDAYSIEEYYAKPHTIFSYADYRWTYGRIEIDSLRLPIPKKNIFPVGNAFANKRIKDIKKTPINSNEICNILVLSDYAAFGDLDMLAIMLSDKLDSNKYKVIFKLHPGETDWRNKYPELRRSKVIVKGADLKHDINYYIAQAHCVVGGSGTALVEAINLNKPTYIYGQVDSSICSEFLYTAGYAKLVMDVQELVTYITKEQKIYNTNNLYESNPVDNVNGAIAQIIKKGGNYVK